MEYSQLGDSLNDQQHAYQQFDYALSQGTDFIDAAKMCLTHQS